MISYEYYESKLTEIKYLEVPDQVVNPETEPIFKVNLNTREITVPKGFEELAVYGDHNAETIWFAVDRWFDGEDLKSKACGVQYENALGEKGLLPLNYVSEQSNETNTPSAEKPVLMLGWTIPYNITKVTGNLNISLRFYKTEETDIIYNLSTEPVRVYIKPGLYITDEMENVNPPKDSLSELVEKIEKIYQNDELRIIDYEKASNKPFLNGTELKGKLFTNYDDAVANTEEVDDSVSNHYIEVSYNDLTNQPMINGHPLIGNISDAELGIKVEVDTALSTSSINPVRNSVITNKVNSLEDSIAQLWEEMDGMTFIPLSISAFNCEPELAEIGDTVNEVYFTWTLGGTPVILKINDNILTIGTSEVTLSDLNLKTDTEFTLYAQDKKANEVSKVIKLLFTYKVFYGVKEAPYTYENTFLNDLVGQLQTSRDGNINVTANTNQYIYYAVPTSYGDCVFTSGGFTGGFTKVATISHENDFGITTNYDIWKSDYSNLGQTNVIIS